MHAVAGWLDSSNTTELSIPLPFLKKSLNAKSEFSSISIGIGRQAGSATPRLSAIFQITLEVVS
jgi:hypothetical protein